MLKMIIIATGITGLVIWGVNIEIFDEDKENKSFEPTQESIPIENEKKEELTFHYNPPIQNHKKNFNINDLLIRMTKLIEEANIAKSHQEFQKALDFYNQVISELQEHHELELEKIYAKAQFYKARLVEFSLGNRDDAIQVYQEIKERFEKSQNVTLLLFYSKAQFYHARMVERDKAIVIYDEIINHFKNSEEVELLKSFAKASFEKSYFSTSYEAIEIYDEIIKRFSTLDNKILLEELYNAQINKAYSLEHYIEDKEETIEVYDQIIKKFSTYDNELSQEKVENALFAKSFLLMGESDHEAMEIFDTLIANYKKKNSKVTPQNMVYSIVNNIELSLISNKDDSEYQDLAQDYLQNSKDSLVEIEMLNILKNAQEDDQSEAIDQWEKKHADYQFENWSFKELEQWNNQMEESESKNRIREYLDRFIKYHTEEKSQKNIDQKIQ